MNVAELLAGGAGVALILAMLWDAFETVVLPHRASGQLRLTWLFYRVTWLSGSLIVRRMRPGPWRESLLSFYGPLSLLLLLAVWAVGLIVAFALIHYALGSALNDPHGEPTFASALYVSGTTLFTLGLGDVTPRTQLARLMIVLEAGTGFGFLALVISYLPVLYQAFSRREVTISLLDARAGSPPTAAELLHRHSRCDQVGELGQLLHDWERWSAELLESHLSYPVLAYYRSLHDNQSWLAALTAILDTCALVSVGIEGAPTWQARLTFAMARHAIVDLAHALGVPPMPCLDRLPPSDLARLRERLTASGMVLRSGADADRELALLRGTYESYVGALASYLLMPLPPWIQANGASDDWQTSPWERIVEISIH